MFPLNILYLFSHNFVQIQIKIQTMWIKWGFGAALFGLDGGLGATEGHASSLVKWSRSECFPRPCSTCPQAVMCCMQTIPTTVFK